LAVLEGGVAHEFTSGRPASRARLVEAAPSLDPELPALALAAAARLKAPLGGGEVYTDDRAPVEWLIDTSIVKAAARGERPETAEG